LDMKITKDRRNQLFNRREIEFEVAHTKTGTPDRFSIRKALTSKASSKLENVYVLEVLSATGTNRSVGKAEVYESAQIAEKVLPKHLLIRNMPPEEREKIKQAEKGKKPEEKKTEEKKVEEKKEKPPPEKPEKEAKKGK